MSKTNNIINNYLKEIGFSSLPKGWDKKSLKKFSKTISKNVDIKDEKWFDKCVNKVKKIKGIENPEGFCAALKDDILGNTKWRGED
ncbi:MAG: hypothetical protein K9L74_05655 [Candidatus Izimaplasma sp.]|nr:hypothetical protein [Candidatus Izimaplasma bacterium]